MLLIFLYQALSVLALWEHKYQAIMDRCFLELNGKLYQGFSNGLSIYNIKTKERNFYSMINSNLPGNYINSFLLLNDNSILISTNGGLAVIENDKITVNKPICTSYPDTDARFLYKDENSNIWTFSATKVYLFKDNTWKTFDLISQNISFRFEILDLFIDQNEALALFNNVNKSSTTFYFNKIKDLYLSIAKINENEIYELWIDNTHFPYRQAGYSLIRVDDELWLQNYNGLFSYKNKTWSQNKIFNFGNYKPFFDTKSFYRDKSGRIWTILEDTLKKIRIPAYYDPKSKEVKVHLEDEGQSFFSINILSDGRIIIWNKSFIYIYDIEKDKWEKINANDAGVPENCYLTMPRIIDGKLYVYLSYIYANYNYDYSYYGTLLCIDDKSNIPKIYMGLPYTSIVQFAVNKKGEGIFEGRFFGEELKYQTSSEFIQPKFYSNVIPIIPATDGNVYFAKLQKDNVNLYSTIATWSDNGLQYIDMGFQDKNAEITNIDSYQEYIVSMGSYSYDLQKDSATTFLSIYNTKNKSLETYDRFNSELPDFYYSRDGYFRISVDTVPQCISADNEGNIWLMTSMSLIKFNQGKSVIYELPKTSTGKPIPFYKIYYDANTDNILACNEFFEPYNNLLTTKYFYFDIKSTKWDSIETEQAGFIGKFVRMKKLLDGKVWACDNLGYMYQYEGEGKFKVLNLNINNKPNLGFQINDFMIDANGYLHLGTDIGLLTNKSILLSLEQNITDDNDIIAYPNPFNSYINIKMDSQDVKALELIDIYGQTIATVYNSDKLNTEKVPAGFYIIKIKTSDNSEKSVKVIKY